MEIRSILVNVGLGGQSNALHYAVTMAEQFGAEIVGVAAAEPHMAVAGIDGAQVALDYYAAEQATIETLLGQAEQRFRAAVPSKEAKWRGSIADTTRVLADEARRCDLVVTADTDTAGVGEGLDLGHLILSCGRPVLVVADGGEKAFELQKVLVAWKDTREARRALSDALPFLKRAKQIQVVTRSEGDTATEAAGLDEIVKWLSLHGVQAESKLIAIGADLIDYLGGTAAMGRPDLVVAGGYGHSRFREWLFGGVTKGLIDLKSVNRLFSN